jgi:hypothetical protein
MTTRADLFNLAKTLTRNFVLPAIAKSALYAALFGVTFFVAGLLVYNFGTGVPLQDANVVFRLIIGIVTVAIYTALGIVIGLTLGATSAVGHKLVDVEQGVHQMITPVTTSIIERMPVGQEGVSIEQFNQIVDARISNLTKESVQRSGIFSVVGIASRFIVRKLLAISRGVLIVNFVQDLQERGETRVNAQALEKFAREKMVRLVINFVRLKLYAVRKISVIVSAISLFIPVLLIGLNLIL